MQWPEEQEFEISGYEEEAELVELLAIMDDESLDDFGAWLSMASHWYRQEFLLRRSDGH